MKLPPLYQTPCELGGQIIDFGGWALPVRYTGIIEEHNQVRKAAGLFDVSHMGEIAVKGPNAGDYLQRVVTNQIAGVKDKKVVYSPMCYADGGTVDDLLVYKYSDEYYLLVVNASNTDKDFEWLRQNLESGVEIENLSGYYAQLAIQGPKAEEILQKVSGTGLNEIRFFSFEPEAEVCGVKAIVSRTGYTGEDGFEIYINHEYAVMVWESLLLAGKEYGLVPVGLGARDTLRFEAALPLYGHELSQDITPLEAGLDRFVRFEKSVFTGKEALLKQKEQGLKRKLTGFEMIDGGIPRNGYEVQANGKSIGYVTSGSFSPSLGKNLGMALVDSAYSNEDTVLEIVIRNRAAKATTVKLPFYTKKYKA